jgi:hypothetical protein
MPTDSYTKTILTLITLLLAVIALKPLFQPQAAAAQSDLSGVQFVSAGNDGFFAFDTKTGNVWAYNTAGHNNLAQPFGKITQLGKPLTR